ncbi:hypothetical protein ABEG17_05525 [Pedococcus sp. KACC 23699]|uniref:Lipoprotein n=1 Tax=Pedococcus sp. KACC 23699 TaxID=3149228 RepID=A0AAU7JWJ3_9MICO
MTRTKTTTVLVAGLLLTGCAGATGRPSTTPSTSARMASTASTSSQARIPDGTWTRDITKAEITRRGLHIAPDVLTANYLDDGSVRLVLKTQGSRWSILVQDDAGAYEVGDKGETTYDAKGLWVQASDSTGTSMLIAWTVRGGTLTTSIHTSPDGPKPADDDVLFLGGQWDRTG